MHLRQLAHQLCIVQDGKHLRILTDILENKKSPLSLKEAVCTILRAGAQAEAVSMSTLTQVRAPSDIQSLEKPSQCLLFSDFSTSLSTATLQHFL